ncbi:hypothetical protein CBM2637_B130245 [Cupriavidus taiwanensis]|nr:hypothetical protein CBM2637_B130245 [Cupriavidus taiwanensis]
MKAGAFDMKFPYSSAAVRWKISTSHQVMEKNIFQLSWEQIESRIRPELLVNPGSEI